MKKWCILAAPETREHIIRWAKSFFHYSENINGENWKYFYSEEANELSCPRFFSSFHVKRYPLINFEEFKLLINTNNTNNTNTINNYEIY